MALDTAPAPAPEADNSPLTLDQHAELMSKVGEAHMGAEDVEDDAPPEATQDFQDSPADPQAAGDGEGAPDTETADAGEAETTSPAKPTHEAPARWDAKGKELFATLQPAAQEYILGREKLQQAEITKAQQRSSEYTKFVEARVNHLNGIISQLGEQESAGTAELGKWEKRLTDWDDWFASDKAAAMLRDDPQSYQANEAQYRQELARANQAKRRFDEVHTKKTAAETTLYADHVKEEVRLLPDLAPELSDPAEGKKRREDLFNYLSGMGYSPERLKWISAQDMAIAWKARKYDLAEAVAKKPAPAQKPKPAGPSAPASGQGQRPSSSEAELRKLEAKGNWSAEDHTRYQILKAKVRK